MRKPLMALLVLLQGGLTPHHGYASTLDTTAHVTAATIFSDRALVTREASLHVPRGAHTIQISNVPAGILEQTLTLEGHADTKVKLGSVDIKHSFATQSVNAAEREKMMAIEAKIDEQQYLQGDFKALQSRADFIDKIIQNGAEKHDATTDKLDFSPEKWSQAWGLIGHGMQDVQKELVSKNIALRKVAKELTVLQQELGQIKSQSTQERRDMLINVESDEDSEVTLKVTYQTQGASWHPVYDARLSTVTAGLDLEQYGQVYQVTGEDWSDIDLTLSTAQPAHGSEMPSLSEWWVSLFNPMPIAAGAMKQSSNSLARYEGLEKKRKAEQFDMSDAPAPMSAAQEVPALPEQAQVQSSEYSAEFKVPGRVALKSSRDVTKLFIRAIKLKAGLSAQVSPSLSESAYLFAKIANTEAYPLIPGSVAKFRDGSFMGNANLALLRPTETADLSFGADDRIKVSHRRTLSQKDNPAIMMMGDMKAEYHYETKIQNLHKDQIQLTVFDHYPVSQDPNVKTELIEEQTTKGYTEDTEKRQGVITWQLSVMPQEEKSLLLGFMVKYPKNRTVIGLP